LSIGSDSSGYIKTKLTENNSGNNTHRREKAKNEKPK
jgi:hypothetical protein